MKGGNFMSKELKLKYILLSIISILLITIIIASLTYGPGLYLNNKCASYVEKYLYELPNDKDLLKEIDKSTGEFLTKNTFEKNYFLSKFQLNYIPDSIFFTGDVGFDKTDLKQEGFIEVIILRLRVLAVQGKYQEYKSLFTQYCDDIADCFFTGCRYVEYWQSDNNYPIKPGNELFELIITEYKNVISTCSTDIDRYHMLRDLQSICLPYKYYEDEVDWCQEEILKIMKNYDSDEFLNTVLEWYGFETRHDQSEDQSGDGSMIEP